METKGYTKLIKLLERCGIDFNHSGDSQENIGDQVAIQIPDDSLGGGKLTLFFNIDQFGKETFYRQEIE